MQQTWRWFKPIDPVKLLSTIRGGLSTYFVEKKGLNPYEGRMKSMLIFALLPLLASV